MTKPAIQNQGFRLDLNLQESFQDDAAWDNLYNPGISKDLAILVNNLRNVSILGQPSTSISLTTTDANNANYRVESLVNVGYKAPQFFTFTDSNGNETDSTFTNDDIIQVSEDIVMNIGTHDGTGAVGNGVAGPDASNTGTYTLVKGTDYFVCSSNARDKFKISTTSSSEAVGVSTIPIVSVNSNGGSFTSTFGFIRKDAVNTPNLQEFIKPEILDENFNYLGGAGINASFTNNLSSYEYSEIMIEKKYKTDKDILTDRDVKFEGSVRVKDPQPYNTTGTALIAKKDDGVTPDTPGVFIGNTRAFSTDNNPWAKDASLFSTKSHSDEFTIGDLEFGGVTNDSGVITDGKIKINGLSAEIVDITEIDSNFGTYFADGYSGPVAVSKFPMIINGETFYILVEKET